MGLIDIKRRKGTSIREFTEEDIRWIRYIITLKDIGFTLEDIKSYTVLKKDDHSTLGERKKILKDHQDKVNKQIRHLKIIEKEIREKISCIESRKRRNED